LHANRKLIGTGSGAASAPNHFRWASMTDRLIVKKIAKVLGMDDYSGARFEKLIGRKSHAALAAVIHLGLIARAAIVPSDFDKCLTIVSEK
jgi:hypothetical protein